MFEVPPFFLPIAGQSTPLSKFPESVFRFTLTNMASTGGDSASVHDDSWPIVPDCSYEAARHVLVTPWDGDVAVVMLSLETTSSG